MKLKHKLFANEYIKNGQNATKAYLKAYPDVDNPESAKVLGSKLLTNINVRAYIDEQLKSIEDKSILSRDEILRLLAQGARGEMKEQRPVFNPASGSIEKIEVDIAPRDRMKSLELAGKTMSLFTDKVDVTGDITISVDLDDD
ncbi:MAG TPA: terminase small subunit [Patescibacteria group bacterium]|nr:terminase small subunit [Patescibacteria group bacterium]